MRLHDDPVLRRLASAVLFALLVLAGAVRVSADNVYFSDLSWSADGTRLRVLAGDGDDLRTLEVEPATGFIRCLDPRVADPVWSTARGRVLFRDRLGVFEVDPSSSQTTAQLILFLPETSAHFIRGVGADARGRLLLWTVDRFGGGHAMWTQLADGLQAIPDVLSGGEALRLWDERNRAEDFTRVGGQFVRSTCVRRSATERRLCLENVSGRFRGRSPFFRITMGAPGGVEVLQNRCAPTGITTTPDTSHVVVGLYEEVDDTGRSEVLSIWVADWENGTRVYETLLPSLVDVRARHSGWAHWGSGMPLLWVDAMGQLLIVETRDPDATVLVPLQMAPARAPLYRVVAATAVDAAAAQPVLERLRESGLDSGLYGTANHFEVQVGAASTRTDARARADELRLQGYPEAREVEGRVDELAVHMGFGWAGGAAAGGGAFVRHTQGQRGVFSEVWYVETAGATPRLLLPAFESVVPIGRGDR